MNQKMTRSGFSRLNLASAEVRMRSPTYLQALLGIGVTEAVSDLAEAA